MPVPVITRTDIVKSIPSLWDMRFQLLVYHFLLYDNIYLIDNFFGSLQYFTSSVYYLNYWYFKSHIGYALSLQGPSSGANFVAYKFLYFVVTVYPQLIIPNLQYKKIMTNSDLLLPLVRRHCILAYDNMLNTANLVNSETTKGGSLGMIKSCTIVNNVLGGN